MNKEKIIETLVDCAIMGNEIIHSIYDADQHVYTMMLSLQVTPHIFLPPIFLYDTSPPGLKYVKMHISAAEAIEIVEENWNNRVYL